MILSSRITPFLKSEDPCAPHGGVQLKCSSSTLESQETVVSLLWRKASTWRKQGIMAPYPQLC